MNARPTHTTYRPDDEWFITENKHYYLVIQQCCKFPFAEDGKFIRAEFRVTRGDHEGQIFHVKYAIDHPNYNLRRSNRRKFKNLYSAVSVIKPRKFRQLYNREFLARVWGSYFYATRPDVGFNVVGTVLSHECLMKREQQVTAELSKEEITSPEVIKQFGAHRLVNVTPTVN